MDEVIIEMSEFQPIIKYLRNKNNFKLFYDIDTKYPSNISNIYILKEMINHTFYDKFFIYTFIANEEVVLIKKVDSYCTEIREFLDNIFLINKLYELSIDYNSSIQDDINEIDILLYQIYENIDDDLYDFINSYTYSGVFITSEVFTLNDIKKIPYSIDFFVVEKNKKKKKTDREIVNSFFSSSSLHYIENICYFNFFDFIYDRRKLDFLDSFEFDMLDNDYTSCIFDIINKVYFEAIQTQQKLEYSYFTNNLDSINRGVSSSPIDILNKIIKNNRLNFKSEIINKQEYEKKKEAYFIIRKKIRDLGLKRGKDFIYKLKENLSEKFYEEVETLNSIIVFQFMNNYFDRAFKEILIYIEQNKLKGIDVSKEYIKLLERICLLIFNQYVFIDNKVIRSKIREEDRISSSKFNNAITKEKTCENLDFTYTSIINKYLKLNIKG